MGARLGRGFGRLWSAYAVSIYGTWIAFGAFPLIAVRVLDAPAFAVSLLDAAGLAVAATVAVPLGPWIQRRAKRRVMIGMDLVRFLAMASVPVAYLLGLLSYDQLLVVAVICGTAGIAFTAASGAYLKHLVPGDRLLAANGRLEGTAWVATATGPPLGGALIGMAGPVVTVAADSASYLLSALGVLRIRGADTATRRDAAARLRAADYLEGWRIIFGDPVLRRLFLNSTTTGGLIMATSPLLAVLLLGRYGFPAWQYGLAFGVPSLGGFAGSRLSARLAARLGRYRVMLATGWLRSVFPLGLAFTRPGIPGLLTVIAVEGLLITCMGVFNPIYATERLQRAPAEHAAEVVTAWSIGSKLSQATLMSVWGVIATLTSPLAAITISGVLLLGTPLLLPKRAHLPEFDGRGGPDPSPRRAESIEMSIRAQAPGRGSAEDSPMSTPLRPRTTTAFFFQAAASFAVALIVTLTGIAYLREPGWVRAFLGLGVLFIVTSAFTLAKCVRDRQEEGALVSRVDQARLDKLLAQQDLLHVQNR